MHPHGRYSYGTNHHIDNLLGSKKLSGQKDYDVKATIKSSNYVGGERVLDDRRRGMLDSARQAEMGDRQLMRGEGGRRCETRG